MHGVIDGHAQVSSRANSVRVRVDGEDCSRPGADIHQCRRARSSCRRYAGRSNDVTYLDQYLAFSSLTVVPETSGGGRRQLYRSRIRRRCIRRFGSRGDGGREGAAAGVSARMRISREAIRGHPGWRKASHIRTQCLNASGFQTAPRMASPIGVDCTEGAPESDRLAMFCSRSGVGRTRMISAWTKPASLSTCARLYQVVDDASRDDIRPRGLSRWAIATAAVPSRIRPIMISRFVAANLARWQTATASVSDRIARLRRSIIDPPLGRVGMTVEPRRMPGRAQAILDRSSGQ